MYIEEVDHLNSNSVHNSIVLCKTLNSYKSIDTSYTKETIDNKSQIKLKPDYTKHNPNKTNERKYTYTDKRVNINNIKVSKSPNKNERIKDYILQMSNPYKFECCGYTVNVKFISDEQLQEKLIKYFMNKV